MKEKILTILIEQCKETGKENNIKGLLNPDLNTKLFHSDGNLDSLGLVAFLIGVEEKIADNFNIDILIVDEKAMSQRSSPFISVKTLLDYIDALLTQNIN
jgi:acyl carrier protein